MASVTKTAQASAFAYTPPESIYNAVRVLVTTAPSVDVEVLRIVLRGIWRMTPHTRVLVTPTPGLAEWMLGGNMTIVDLDLLPLRPYPSRVEGLPTVMASHLINDCGGCIHVASVTAETLTDIPPSLAGLRALCASGLAELSDTDALTAAYFALRDQFAGSVVDTGEQVTWCDDLLDTDTSAYRLLGQPTPLLLAGLRKLRKQNTPDEGR